MKTAEGLFKSEKVKIRILLAIALIIYFAFGFYHLSDFISADEHFWLPNASYERIEAYWKAVERGDWKDTQINDKPGITLAWTSGIAMLFDDAKGQIVKSEHNFKQFDPARTQRINFLYRLPILLISGFFSLFFFWIIKKITENTWVALFSTAGILLSPILLGISQIVNPDSLFWIFGAASFFSFYAFLQRLENRLAVLSLIFLGLALASKYVSVIFFPFFFFTMVAYYFFEYEKFKGSSETFRKAILKSGIAYVIILAGGLLIFAIMMPAAFVKPKSFYSGTIGFPGMEPIFWITMFLNALLVLDAAIFNGRGLEFIFTRLSFLRKFFPKIVYFAMSATFIFILFNWMARNSLVDLSDIPFDLKRSEAFAQLPFLEKYVMEFVPLVFSLTPLAVFGLLFLWLKSFFSESRFKTLIFVISSFFPIFYFAVIFQDLLVTARYSIILFPFAMVLVAVAIEEFMGLARNRENKISLTVFLSVSIGIAVMFLANAYQQSLSKVGQDQLYSKLSDKVPLLAAAVFFIILIFTAIIYKYFPWKLSEKVKKIWIFAGFLAISLISLLRITPYYFSYTNDLLPKKYIISGAWGYGGYEAAQYLNSLPDARNLTLWADSYGVCEFFVGKCIHKAKLNTAKYPIDYYFRSLQATLAPQFPHPANPKPVWELEIDGRPKSFLKILKAQPADNLQNNGG